MLTWLIRGSGLAALGYLVWWLVRRGSTLKSLGRGPMMSPLGGITVLAIYYFCITIVASAVLLAIWGRPPAGQIADPAVQAPQAIVYYVTTFSSVVAWFFIRRSAQERTWCDSVRKYWSGVEHASPARKPESVFFCLRTAVVTLIVAWPVIVLSGNVTRWIIQRLTGHLEGELAHKVLKTLSDAPLDHAWPWLMIGSVVFLAPVVEEVVYRGALQAMFRPVVTNPWVAIVTSAICFGLMHIGSAEWIAIPGLAIFGVALGYTYERTGRIMTPIITHMLFNLGNIGILMIARSAPG